VLCALLFMAWTVEVPRDSALYGGHWRSPFQYLAPFFEPLPLLTIFPWQVLLLLLAPFCLLAGRRRRAASMEAAILASLASVAVTVVWGLLRGGSGYQAYYQLWRFMAALLMAALLMGAVRHSRALAVVGATVLAAAVVRAALAIYFYLVHVRDRITPPPAHMTTHDDSVLFVAGLLITLSWALARATLRHWVAALFVCAHLLYAIILNNRRLAWVEIALGLVTMCALLPRGALRRRVFRTALVAAPALAIYVAVGSGRSGLAFAPLRAVATTGSYTDNSSLARGEENRNLIYTLTSFGNPLLGTGWGHPYAKVSSTYSNYGEEWWQYLFMPHNSLLGVIAFSGLAGLFGIWCVIPVTAFLARRAHVAAAHRVDRAATMAAIGVLPAYAAQCYGDLGFQSLTGGLIISVAMAAAGSVTVRSRTAEPAPPRAPGRTGRPVARGTPPPRPSGS
jgi:hypothetical protein